jgi:hypothetical protein
VTKHVKTEKRPKPKPDPAKEKPVRDTRDNPAQNPDTPAREEVEEVRRNLKP